MSDEGNPQFEAELAAAWELPRKIDLMNAMAADVLESDVHRAIALCETALGLTAYGPFQAEPYLRGLADSLDTLGKAYIRLGNGDMLESFISRAVSLIRDIKPSPERALVLNAIGTVYQYLGNLPDALDAFLKALEIFKTGEAAQQEAFTYLQIGRIYQQLGDLPQAGNYLEKCLQLAEKLENKELIAESTSRLCSILDAAGHYRQALDYGLKSVQLCDELGLEYKKVVALNYLGRVFAHLDMPRKSLDALLEAYSLCEQNNYVPEMVVSLQYLGETYLRSGELENALWQLHQALSMAQKIKSRAVHSDLHRGLSDVYRAMGDFERALEHSEEYHRMKEEMTSVAANQRARNLEMMHQVETARREAEISHLKNVILLEEIRTRKQAEKSLRQVNQKLTEEIRIRETLIADLNAFAQTVAHDLKNPLQNISISSGILWTTLNGKVDQQGQALIQTIIQTSQQMNRIISELLVLASVRQKDFVPIPVEMGRVVEQVEQRLAAVIQENQASIKKPESWPIALGHAAWLEEVWVNYIDNAIKYGGKPPKLVLGADHIGKGYIQFWVKDNGPGLSEGEISQLFTPFTQFSKDEPQRHGLGLSIVRRIIEKMNGAVGVESSAISGEGCKFHFTLPALQA